MRRTRETAKNAESSRSHAVYTLHVEAVTRGDQEGLESVRSARLNLVDLAGGQSLLLPEYVATMTFQHVFASAVPMQHLLECELCHQDCSEWLQTSTCIHKGSLIMQ